MSRISVAMRSDRKGFAIFLAMLLTILIILMGVYLIDKLMPASKDVKGVEHGNVAYYKASSATELALSSLSGSLPGSETGSTAGSLSGSGYKLSTVGSGTIVPAPGFGNSEYDRDWNVVSAGRPIQIKLPAWYNPGGLQFEFRVPDLDEDGKLGETWHLDNSTEALSGATAQILNWSVSGNGDTLVSAASQLITANGVNQTASVVLWTLTWSDLSNATQTVNAFAGTKCSGATRCTLKISVIRALETVAGTGMPYLEYRITTPTSVTIPQQWTRVSSEGYSRGFSQSRTRNVEQTTVNEALDFTIFQ